MLSGSIWPGDSVQKSHSTLALEFDHRNQRYVSRHGNKMYRNVQLIIILYTILYTYLLYLQRVSIMLMFVLLGRMCYLHHNRQSANQTEPPAMYCADVDELSKVTKFPQPSLFNFECKSSSNYVF